MSLQTTFVTDTCEHGLKLKRMNLADLDFADDSALSANNYTEMQTMTNTLDGYN